MRTSRWRVIALLTFAAAIGCGGGGAGSSPVVVIARASTLSGNAQTGTVNQALPLDLRVQVTEDGSLKAGATVQWAAAAGSVVPASSVTGADGIAATTWTLGQTAGSQTASAMLSGATGSPVGFTATGIPGPAAAFTKSAGDGQITAPNAAFGTALAVRVADQFGNGISGTGVDWAVQSGSATVGGATSVTDFTGIATIGVTAGPTVGPAVVRATTAAVAGNLDFALTVVQLPLTRSVTVGNFFFSSDGNATSNPAVDTIAAGGTVTWTWVATGLTPHSVRSTGGTFTSSATLTGNLSTYSFLFPAAGTFQYDCVVHGSGMTGRVVVR